jgi:hypothetical protein
MQELIHLKAEALFHALTGSENFIFVCYVFKHVFFCQLAGFFLILFCRGHYHRIIIGHKFFVR